MHLVFTSWAGRKGSGGRGRWLAAARGAVAAPSTVVLQLRCGLFLACAAAIAVAAWLGDPSGYWLGDPALARLLRGMALIKGMIAIAAMGAVFWRLRWPIPPAVAAGCLLGCSAMAGSAMLIWQLSFIVPAALLFHSAALTLLLLGWRERQRATA